MTKWLYGLARKCAEHGRLVIAIWIIALVVVSGGNRLIGGASQSTISLSGTNSATAQLLLGQAFPGASTEANPLVINSPTQDMGTGAGAATVAQVAKKISSMPTVASVQTPKTQPALLSADTHTAIISITVADSSVGKLEVAQSILDTGKQTAGPDYNVALGGIMGTQLSKPNTKSSEILGILAALVVLFITMRRFSAMFIPLINAIFAVGIGLAIISLLGRLVYIPDVAPTLGTMLGLGVGIDYALFLITRHRKLLQQGYEVPDAAGRTAGTAGAGIVFAGGTLLAAVCGLALTGLSFLAWLGFAAAIVVALAVVASLTLVPALLGVVGRRVVPKSMAEPLDEEHHEILDRSGWARLATAVTGRPWQFAIISTVVLLVMAAPMLTMKLGHTDAGNLPQETTARQADDLISAGFGPGTAAPLAIVVQMYTPATAPATTEPTGTAAAPTTPASSSAPGSNDPRTKDPRLISLKAALAATPGVVAVGNPVVSTDGGVAVIKVTPQWGSADPETELLVRDLRANVIPPAVAGKGMAAYVGGVTALTTDLMDLIAQRTPLFILGVVMMSFVLLMIAYRSLLIPFKAAVMNLLSITAAYGVVTVIFQWGWGASLIGLDELVPIESFIPMMMFAVLFGLSMDYEVFLLTAFREHWEQTGDMHTAVRRGLADTGRLVTAAALIMVVVFGSFVLSDNATVKMFGIGLATAVAVDATIVRCLLVPAIMVLAAKGTWWLPGWLDRLLPHLHVEGDPTAIDEIAAARSVKSTSSKPLLAYRPAPVIGAVIGVGLSWMLVSRLSIVPVDARTAVAMAAVLAGISVLLPPGFGGGRGTLSMRTLGYIIGVLLGLAVTGLLAVVVPPVQADNGAVTSWAIVIVALLAVLLASRAIALPLVLGAVAVAVTLGLIGAATDSIVLLAVTVLPALITVTVTWMVSTIFDRKNLGGLAIANHTVEEPAPNLESRGNTELVHVDQLLAGPRSCVTGSVDSPTDQTRDGGP